MSPSRTYLLSSLHKILLPAQATVGAGLPVIATLRHLIETGDKILRVEGIFSGTLSYIFNSFKPGITFSSIVAQVCASTLHAMMSGGPSELPQAAQGLCFLAVRICGPAPVGPREVQRGRSRGISMTVHWMVVSKHPVQ